MRKHFLIYILSFFFVAHSLQCTEELKYTVNFTDIHNDDLLNLLRKTSTTYTLKNKPLISLQLLKKRSEADIPKLINALHYMGYYSCKIEVGINQQKKPIEVSFFIDTGPQYTLHDFQALSTYDRENGLQETPEAKQARFNLLNALPLSILQIGINQPISTKQILESEKLLANYLKQHGYPFASISNRTVVADRLHHTLSLTFWVNTGPLCYFGPTKIKGLKKVKSAYVRKKIGWNQGEVYAINKLAQTQSALESSGLFNFVSIDETPPAPGEEAVPMTIQLEEAKQHSIGAGVGYTSDNGFGVVGEWEHRNVGHVGNRLSFITELWEKTQNSTLTYRIPDFRRLDQNLLWIAEFDREIRPNFNSTAYKLSSLVERRWSNQFETIYGVTTERLRTHKSDNNRLYHLLKAPLQLKWNNANNILDPTRGFFFNTKLTPSQQILRPRFSYLVHQTSLGNYLAFSNERLVFATKITLGNIWGASRHTLPPPERFYAGSENTLRGYKFQTVSPLDQNKEPLGGRSMLVGSFELRWRRGVDKIGWVGFYEIGNVYTANFPEVKHKQLQSAGIGLRYGTPIGPIRMDIAFPLNRRPGIDRCFQLYFSIGQTF